MILDSSLSSTPGARAQGVAMDFTSFPTLSQEQQNVSQDHVDRQVNELLSIAAPQQDSTATLALEEAVRGRTQAQEPRRSDNSSPIHVVQGLARAIRGVQMQQQQQAATALQEGAFRVSQSNHRPALFVVFSNKGRRYSRRL